jgi:hypothetical protein
VTFVLKSQCLWDNVEKMWWRQRTQALWRLRATYWISKPTHAQAQAGARAPTPTHTHTHTHTEICNTYRFSTATVVSWTHLSVTVRVHCLSCTTLLYTYTRSMPVSVFRSSLSCNMAQSMLIVVYRRCSTAYPPSLPGLIRPRKMPALLKND